MHVSKNANMAQCVEQMTPDVELDRLCGRVSKLSKPHPGYLTLFYVVGMAHHKNMDNVELSCRRDFMREVRLTAGLWLASSNSNCSISAYCTGRPDSSVC